jgi:hypothetical protein
MCISRHIFEKYSNIKFRENPSSGGALLHADERTDGHDEANRYFSQFCERAKKTVQKLMRVRMEKFKCVWKEGNCFRESIHLNLAEVVCEVPAWTELI